MNKLTKTQRNCLRDAGIYPLWIIEQHDDGCPLKARNADNHVYGRHTLHTLLSPGWLENRNDSLILTQEGMMQLSPETAFIVTAIRCLKASLPHLK